MPSIEILCVEARGPVIVGDLPFPVQVSPDRRSHRSPAPRFQAEFNRHRGVLYHLGNPGWVRGNVFFAYELLDHPIDDGNDEDDELEALVFLPAFVSAVSSLLDRLMEASATKRLLFTSDWQFGPDESVRGESFTLAKFWDEHHARRLRYNAAYWIVDAT